MKLAIIIPAYNEEKRIGNTLNAFSGYFENLRKRKVLDYEIIIVINNTHDKTEDVVKSFRKKNKQISYLNLKKGGKGYATIEGFKKAIKDKFDLIGFVDADMATPPESFYALVKEIKGYDGTIASRYVEGSVVNSPSKFRRIFVSRTFNFIVRTVLLLSYQDTQCGAKLFRREPLERVISDLTQSQWAFDVDLLYNFKRHNFKVKEVPTVWYESGGSHLNVFSSGPFMALGVIRLRLINSPLRVLVRAYDKFIGLLLKLR